MTREGNPLPAVSEWRDPSAYHWLLDVERAGFAWEWLRRQPRYREAALEALEGKATRGPGHSGPLEWGLHAFEHPAKTYSDARPLWASWRYSWVLPATSKWASADGDVLDLTRLGTFPKTHESEGIARLLLSDGKRSVRLDLRGASPEQVPVSMSFELSGVRSLDRPLLLLQRLRSLVTKRRFVRSLHPPLRRAARLVQLLRAFDALREGASQADLAEFILEVKLERRQWRVHSPSLRTRAQRLAEGARAMAAGQFWKLLS